MKSLRVRLSAALLAALLVALLAISFETVRRADAVLSPEIERKAATLADSSAALIGKALALGIPVDRLHGLDAHFARIVAENDYAVIVPQEVWATHGALLATRVDGRPHSRRARGPLQIVFDMQARPDTGLASFEGNWVWMVAWIGPPD